MNTAAHSSSHHHLDPEQAIDNNSFIHLLFEQQVELTPNAVALHSPHKTLSYRELNNKANQLAHYLQQKGIRTNSLVGISIDRSLEMIIGILGILKAGGAYVPLDSTYPIDRLQSMIEDTSLSVILTQEHLSERINQLISGQTHQIQAIPLDMQWAEIAQQPSENLPNQALLHSLCYVIYTSGSTGKPKGVAIDHAGAWNEYMWRHQVAKVDSNDRVIQASTLNFDISVWEICGPLCWGAELFLGSHQMQRDPAEIASNIIEYGITYLQLTPALYRLVLEQPALIGYQAMRIIVVGGDVLAEEVVQRTAISFPNARLFNIYGPTETIVEVTYWICNAETDRGNIPIGIPTLRKKLYILDSNLQQVAPGEEGELYIGGVGMALGYLNRPELTAERFVPNPFTTEEDLSKPYWQTYGHRLYRTGDLVRQREDGAYEFLGRIDNQVKIRGFRIELGEIETSLMKHPNILHAAVVARDTNVGTKQLVAYLTLKQANFDLQHQGQLRNFQRELRDFLGQLLPEYMVPTLFMVLENMPFTPSGKIDRKVLPTPVALVNEETELSAETPIQEQLIDLWKQVLQIESVGPDDNFFEIGGDSILSMHLVAQAQKQGLHLSARQLFEYPTIAELAQHIDTSSVIQAEQGEISGSIKLTPIQQWFFEMDITDPHHWNQAMLLDIDPAVNREHLDQALRKIIQHHDALRLCFQRTENGWQAHHVPYQDEPVLGFHSLGHLTGEDQLNTLENLCTHIQSSLDLSKAPRLRATYFEIQPNQSARLLVAINYPSIDGVSWRVLLEDLQTIYSQLQAQQSAKLPSKTTSYQQWSQRLHDYAQSPECQRQLDYWLQSISGPIPSIPIDHNTGPNTAASACHITRTLSHEETRALLQEVHSSYQTQINDLLLAALQRAWQNWSGQTQLLINLESHGREAIFEDLDVSRTVGWFTSLFPLKLSQANSEDLRALIVHTKEQLRQLPDHGFSYSILRYLSHDLFIREALNKLPQAQVRFNYLGQFDQMFTGGIIHGRASESAGLAHSPRGLRDHILVAEGMVINGQLSFTWSYSTNIHQQHSIEQLADCYQSELQNLIAHCRNSSNSLFTASDFQYANLNQEQFDLVSNLLSALDQED